MVLILGTGYIAQAFARELQERELDYAVLHRKVFDYPNFATLTARLNFQTPDLLINASGFCGSPNVDECEARRSDTLLANVVLPVTIANAAAMMHVPWIHISSGCVFNGVSPDGAWTEKDIPNFGFDNPMHSFYSASKAVAERALAGVRNCFVCRLRMPFDNIDHPKNLLSKLQRYQKVCDSPPNSLSHLGDSVRACVDLIKWGAEPGIYNIVNPGSVTNHEIAEMIKVILNPKFDPEFFKDDLEFYRTAAKTPRSSCVLSCEKLKATGIKMRNVNEALRDSLKNWKKQP